MDWFQSMNKSGSVCGGKKYILFIICFVLFVDEFAYIFISLSKFEG